MKRMTLLTVCLLSLLLLLSLVACNIGDYPARTEETTKEALATRPLLTTVVDTAPPLPDVDYTQEEFVVTDYSFTYGCFVKSHYNGAGNPLERVYYNPTTMMEMPLSFSYTYGTNGILSAFVMGKGANAVAFELIYNSQGLPAMAEYELDGALTRVSFTCDSKGRILGEQINFLNFSYDSSGHLVKESGVSFAGSYEIITVREGTVAFVTAKAMGEDAFDLEITYNEMGYPVSMTGVVNGVEPWQYIKGLAQWEYDAFGRCTFVSVKGVKDHTTVAYTYRFDGALDQKTVSSYNQAGELISQKTYDASGNLIQPEVTEPEITE